MGLSSRIDALPDDPAVVIAQLRNRAVFRGKRPGFESSAPTSPSLLRGRISSPAGRAPLLYGLEMPPPCLEIWVRRRSMPRPDYRRPSP